MPNVRAVHAIQSGRRTFEPGSIVPIATDAEAERLIRLGAAEAIDDRPQVDEDVPEESDLPADLPGRAVFISAGFTELHQILDVEDLTSIDGIGQKTAEAVEAYLNEADEE